MAEDFHSNRYLKRVVLIGAWILGIWTPLQTGYTFLSKNLAFFHVDSALLPHLLIYACWITGGFSILWVMSSGVIFLILYAFSDGKDEETRNRAVAIKAAIAGICGALLVAYVFTSDKSMRLPTIHDEISLDRGGVWVAIVTGAAILVYVYLLIYRSIKKTVTQMKKEGALEG